jgi:hypothetical protein
VIDMPGRQAADSRLCPMYVGNSTQLRGGQKKPPLGLMPTQVMFSSSKPSFRSALRGQKEAAFV